MPCSYMFSAYRSEVTEDIIDGPNSNVFEEAENRLCAKAICLTLMQGIG